MSRVGRKLIVLPAGVTAVLNGKNVAIKGPKGTLDFTFHKDMEIVSENNTISVTRPSDSLEHRALHGTTRALLNNMVLGVTTGFAKTLDIKGVGQLMELAVAGGRRARPGMKIGICGEHGGHPASIAFCHAVGLSYVSCSGPRVPVARLAAAHAALNEAPEQRASL